MRLVKAVKASPLAKFYNLSTENTILIFTKANIYFTIMKALKQWIGKGARS